MQLIFSQLRLRHFSLGCWSVAWRHGWTFGCLALSVVNCQFEGLLVFVPFQQKFPASTSQFVKAGMTTWSLRAATSSLTLMGNGDVVTQYFDFYK